MNTAPVEVQSSTTVEVPAKSGGTPGSVAVKVTATIASDAPQGGSAIPTFTFTGTTDAPSPSPLP